MKKLPKTKLKPQKMLDPFVEELQKKLGVFVKSGLIVMHEHGVGDIDEVTKRLTKAAPALIDVVRKDGELTLYAAMACATALGSLLVVMDNDARAYMNTTIH